MKKTILSILLFILFIPFIVKAENDTCEKVSTNTEKTVEIKITQEIINKDQLSPDEINNAKFTYKTLDLNDNVLAETTNGIDENIIFDCFTVKVEDLFKFQKFDDSALLNELLYQWSIENKHPDGFKIYKIIMEENESSSFEIDPYVIYFSLRPNWTEGIFDPIVAFYKDDGDDSPERYNTTYKGEVFHATEEELQGQAYAVFDETTGILTFFRDDENKYQNKEKIGDKTYYTDFEKVNSYSVPWHSSQNVKKIVFRDAIKPLSIVNWFTSLPNLEEADISKLDTSLITSLDYFFSRCPKLKTLDISTMDVANVTSMFQILYHLDIEYIDFTVWNLNQNLERMQISEMVQTMPRLKYLNISNFGKWSSSAEFYDMPCLEKLVLNNTYDFYSSSVRFGGPYDNTITPKWYNPQKDKLYSQKQIYYNYFFKIEDMSGAYISPSCTTSASFVAKYNPPPTNEPEEIEQQELKNPETKDHIIILMIVILISAFSILVLHKKQKELV